VIAIINLKNKKDEKWLKVVCPKKKKTRETPLNTKAAFCFA